MDTRAFGGDGFIRNFFGNLFSFVSGTLDWVLSMDHEKLQLAGRTHRSRKRIAKHSLARLSFVRTQFIDCLGGAEVRL